MLRVTPVYGSQGHHPSCENVSVPPVSTLVEYGGVRVLVDVGWDESYMQQSQFRWSATGRKASSLSSLSRRQGGKSGGVHHPPVKLPEADVVLVSNSSLNSIGGLPLFFGRSSSAASSAGDKNKKEQAAADKQASNDGAESSNVSSLKSGETGIYGTYPTAKMAQMSLYELHATSCQDGPFQPGWDLDDVDHVFSSAGGRFTTLKYSQSITVTAKGGTKANALTITPFRAGHVVGACFWVLRSVRDDTDVVICSGAYNHAKERHLDPCALPDCGAVPPDVLICRPGGPAGPLSALYSPDKALLKRFFHTDRNATSPDAPTRRLARSPVLRDQPRSQVERDLIEGVMVALRRGGHVLLPVDASGRVLELLLLLSNHWARQRLSSTYRLVWVGPMARNTLDYARCQLEWMASPLGRQFDSQRGHPYALRDVVLVDSAAQVELLEEDGLPLAVLASGASLDRGPARDLLLRWADNPDNAIILTDSQRCVMRPAKTTTTTLPHRTRATSNSQLQPSNKASATPRVAAIPSDAATTTTPTPTTPATAPTDDDDPTAGTALTQEETSTQSTAAQLLLHWCEARAQGRDEMMPGGITVDVLVPSRAPLAGRDLASFLAEEEEARREKVAREERRAMLREVELARGRLRLGEEDLLAAEAEDAAAGGGGSSSTAGASDASGTAKQEKRSKTTSSPTRSKSSSKKSGTGSGRFDSNLFLKFSKPLYMTFDVREEAVGIGQSDRTAKFGVGESVGAKGEVLEDEYGIAVIPERFHDIVTGIDRTRGRITDDALGFFRASGIGVGAAGANATSAAAAAVAAAGVASGGGSAAGRGLGFGSDGRPVLSAAGVVAAASSTTNPDGDTMGGTTPGTAEERERREEEEEQIMQISDLSEGRGIIRGRRGRPPIGVSTVPRRLEVLAEVTYVPLEGRVSARAARQMVRSLQPRQVVILGGDKPRLHFPFPQSLSLRRSSSVGLDPRDLAFRDSDGEDDDEPDNEPVVITDDEGRQQKRRRLSSHLTSSKRGQRRVRRIEGEAKLLADAVKEVTMRGKDASGDGGESIFVPANGETIELKVGHAAYTARLIDTPHMTAEEKKMMMDEDEEEVEAEAQATDIVEAKVGQYAVSRVDMVATGQRVAADGSIVLAPRARRQRGRRDNFLLSEGEVLLTDLRSEMIAQGMKAEYTTHAGYQRLVVNGKIVVTKDQSSGRINVEGPLCQDYFTVRTVVCSQYTILW